MSDFALMVSHGLPMELDFRSFDPGRPQKGNHRLMPRRDGMQSDQFNRLQLPQSAVAGPACNTEGGKLVGWQRDRSAFANLATAIDHLR
jgi:hypothetical protein